MLKVSSIKFNNEFRTSQDLSFLLACIGEKVTITISFYYEDITYATENNKVILKPNGQDVDLYDTTGVIWSEDGIAFNNTYIGDTIGIYTGGAYQFVTVTEKFNDGMIRTNYGGSLVELSYGSTEFIFNATPFSGVRYAYNLIDTGNSFNSLVDGEYQQLITGSADTTNATPVNMSFAGIKSYQIGSATIKGDGGAGGGGSLGQYVQQKFTITHITRITPIFLANEYNDLLLGIKPSYFDVNNCLNYIAKISLGRNLNDPNGLQEFDLPVLQSNTGWFNEKFNGGATNYSITSVVYKDSNGDIITKPIFNDDCTVEITISNTTDTPFSSGNTKYVFGFNYLPEEESLYQNTGNDLATNFLLDAKKNTVGGGSVNGDNYSTSMQVIKSVTSTYVSTSQIKVKATINIVIGSDAHDIITSGSYSRFAVWVITENHALSAINSDKVNLLADVNEFDYRLTTSDLIGSDDIQLIFHPHEDETEAIDVSQNIHPVDDVVAYFPFHIDFTDHTASEGIKINKVRSKLLLRDTNNVESDILLEDFTIDTSNYPIVGGQAQDIDFTQDRVFKIIDDEIRKQVVLTRDFANDSGNVKCYKLLYPFMLRWEYWEELISTTHPSGLFDSTKRYKGFNHFWQRLVDVSTFRLFYEVDFTVEQNGVEFSQSYNEQLTINYDFDENTEWGNTTIKSYDLSNNELLSGSNKLINGFAKTKIVASFEKLTGAKPQLADVGIVIWIETYESGGEKDIRRASSYYNISDDSNSWFYNASDKVDVSRTGNTYKGTVYIDNTKLPKNGMFTIYARIYDFYNTKQKTFQDDSDFNYMDGNLYEFQ